jgi:nucleoside-diphosphate-sugar epimerase
MRTIAIAGASGFIGRRLLLDLLEENDIEIRLLSRSKDSDWNEDKFSRRIEVFEGSLVDAESLKDFLQPGCTVINLVYLWNTGEKQNRACMDNLLSACRDAKVARLIHCSTAAVVGRSLSNLIDEQTKCFPISEYGITKLKIEQDIVRYSKGHFDAVILRPTSVFGVGGDPLKTLANDLWGRRSLKNYLKSCLFGKRRMNLVPVATVVSAIMFLANHEESFEGEIFITSADEDPKNNFADVERYLMNAFGFKGYFLPRIPVPLGVLKMFLTLLRRNNVNPQCNFDQSKLVKFGFNSPVTLSEGLAEYAMWFGRSKQVKNGSEFS